MTDSEIYMIFCYVGLALCLLSLAFAAFFFFRLNIIRVIGDLSGSNARKGIENIRNQNRVSGNKAHKPSNVNRERGMLTDKISSSGELLSKKKQIEVSVGTEKIVTGSLINNQTTCCDPRSYLSNQDYGLSEETKILNHYQNDTVAQVVDDTTLLGFGQEETVVLNADDNFYKVNSRIEVEDEIIFVHTNERI